MVRTCRWECTTPQEGVNCERVRGSALSGAKGRRLEAVSRRHRIYSHKYEHNENDQANDREQKVATTVR